MENWETTTLGEICRRGGGNIQTGPFGSQLHASDYVSVGIPSIMPVNIGENRINSEGIARITIEDAKRLEKYRVREGDIVYSRRGDVERRALIRAQENGWLCGTGCLRIRFGEGVVEPLFASYYLGDSEVRKWIVRHAVGATMPNLNTSILSALPFVVPPIEEQKAIAKILSSLDDKIELNRQMNATLEAMARALFKAWFVDFEPVRAKMENRPSESASPEIAKLFPSEFENEIPRGWEVKELNQIFEVNPLRRLQKGKKAKYLDMANVPPSGHRVSGWINREFSSGTKFKKGDTLLARITPCLENGKTAFVDFLDDEEIGWGSTEFIVLRPKNGLPNYFAYLLCRNDDFRNFAIKSMTGTSGRQRVQVDSLGKYKLLVPPDDSLIGEKFGVVLNPIAEKIRQNSEETASLSQIRDSLLPRLISGKIRCV